MVNNLDGSVKNRLDVIFKVALQLNFSWLAVVLCIVIPGVSIWSAPRSALCLISVAVMGVAAFYCRLAMLRGSGRLAKDLLVSAGVMSSVYANIWAYKILIAVVMVSMGR